MELWSTVISAGQDGLSHTTTVSSLVNKLITNSGPPLAWPGITEHNALSSVKPQYSFNTFITFSAGSILNVTRKLCFIVPGQPI